MEISEDTGYFQFTAANYHIMSLSFVKLSHKIFLLELNSQRTIWMMGGKIFFKNSSDRFKQRKLDDTSDKTYDY